MNLLTNYRKSFLFIVTTIVLIVAFIYIDSLKKENTINVISLDWGLNFEKDGEVPIGNASAEYLKQFGAYYVGETAEKKIYLTFDAGYENGYTSHILDVLFKNDVQATFFLVGTYLKENQQLVKRMIQEGHIIGNHTNDHLDLSKTNDEKVFNDELISFEEIYFDILGQKMKKLYRPPEGKFNETNLIFAQKIGYNTIFWSLAYEDWYNQKQPTKEAAFSTLLPRIHPGIILLLHSTSKTNSEILDELIIKIKDMGYSFESLNDFLKY